MDFHRKLAELTFNLDGLAVDVGFNALRDFYGVFSNT
jgi:hypothetical protein